jgi:hypothetical protein
MLDSGLRPVRRAIIGALSLGIALVTVTAGAQTPTLAEVAKKEQERRKTQKAPAKVYTKKDLPPSPQGRGAAGPGQAPQAAAEPKPDAKPEEEAKDEAWWKNRINAVREELRRNEMFAEALQTRINSLSTDFVNRDDPYQRAKIGTDRDKAISELSRVKADIELGKKKIEDIEEEARKAGVPPGWLR